MTSAMSLLAVDVRICCNARAVLPLLQRRRTLCSPCRRSADRLPGGASHLLATKRCVPHVSRPCTQVRIFILPWRGPQAGGRVSIAVSNATRCASWPFTCLAALYVIMPPFCSRFAIELTPGCIRAGCQPCAFRRALASEDDTSSGQKVRVTVCASRWQTFNAPNPTAL